MNIFLALIISYLVGSVPTAVWLGRVLADIDIRQHGSGNSGATNAFRVLGWKHGLFVLIVDMLKGVLPVVFLPDLFPAEIIPGLYPMLIGALAIIGHIFPVWAKFKGGKGVGTAAGVFAALVPLSFATALLVFGIAVWLTRYVSLGSILGAVTIALTIPVFQALDWQQRDPALSITIIILCIVVIIMHRSNIRRLIRGEERKIKSG